jgi:hypothetical protein
LGIDRFDAPVQKMNRININVITRILAFLIEVSPKKIGSSAKIDEITKESPKSPLLMRRCILRRFWFSFLFPLLIRGIGTPT